MKKRANRIDEIEEKFAHHMHDSPVTTTFLAIDSNSDGLRD